MKINEMGKVDNKNFNTNSIVNIHLLKFTLQIRTIYTYFKSTLSDFVVLAIAKQVVSTIKTNTAIILQNDTG